VTERPVKNMAASIHQRLLNLARETGRPFNELLQYYGMERFLYRLAHSRHGKKFVLKGALMLGVWKAPLSRPTMDIDLLGRLENSVETLAVVARDACNEQVEPDGLAFEPDTVTGERIAEHADYAGVRIRLRGMLGNARINIQMDVGFGDVVFPAPVSMQYPTLLDLPAPRLRGYSRETAVAEKFEAMVKLGLLNSRMKDFFDVWLLCRLYEFDGNTLGTAITRTFAHRQTDLSAEPEAFTPAFAGAPAKQSQWRAFLRRIRLQSPPPGFDEVVQTISGFLKPVAEALAAGKGFAGKWSPSGPWG
jgi:predicted nucleotidyltransferase component of viral defense system